MNNKLQKAYQEFSDSVSQKPDIILGDLGIQLGGNTLVEVPNRPSYVYVRLRGNRSEIVQAYNDKVAQRYDLPVELTYKDGKYIVLGRNDKQFTDWVNDDPYIAKHAPTHIFNKDGLQVGGDIVWTYPYQFMPSLVHPFNTPGATNVYIHSHPMFTGEGWIQTGGTGTSSLLTYKPNDGNTHLALVALEVETGNPALFIYSGTSISNDVTGSSYLIPYYPIPDAGYVPLSVVRLVSGTSTIGWENIYDARQFIVRAPNSLSGSDYTGRTALPSNPTVNDDANDGYLNLHLWLNTASGDLFVLRDNTPGSALWVQVGGESNISLFFEVDGALAVVNPATVPISIYQDTDISIVHAYVEYLGITGTNTFDILRNGVTSILSTPISIPFNNPTNYLSVVPSITSFTSGDTLQLSILGAGSGSYGARVSMQVDRTGASGTSFNLVVSETDSLPLVNNVGRLDFPRGSVVDNGDGSVTISTISYSCYIKRVATQNISSTGTAIAFDTEVKDDYGMFLLASPSDVTTISEGWYSLSGVIYWGANTGNGRRGIIKVNGTEVARQSVIANTSHNDPATNPNISAIYLNLGDVVTLFADHNDSGETITVTASLSVGYIGK